MTPSVGLMLTPDEESWALLEPLFREECEHFEVAPETLWRADFRANGYHAKAVRLRDQTGRPFIAHGVGLSIGTVCAADAGRRRQWLRRMREDQSIFRFGWYTDHLGASSLDGLALTLPMPLPMTAEHAAIVRRRLREMQRAVPDVGVENNVIYFALGDPAAEPRFLNEVTRAPRTHLLLDLHNVHTVATNFGLDPYRYASEIDLTRVIEIHLSGGSQSDGRWLKSGNVMRLDSHDTAVPEEVWRLFEHVLPRCPNLRAVTLERMEGSFGAVDVPAIREELDRSRVMVRGSRPSTSVRPKTAGRLPKGTASETWEKQMAAAMRAPNPWRAVRALAGEAVSKDGVEMTALLVARLRFERLTRGSPEAERWFEAEPAQFARAFKRYHTQVPPTAFFPHHEAALFEAWLRAPDRKPSPIAASPRASGRSARTTRRG